jgi:hypothetical protein
MNFKDNSKAPTSHAQTSHGKSALKLFKALWRSGAAASVVVSSLPCSAELDCSAEESNSFDGGAASRTALLCPRGALVELTDEKPSSATVTSGKASKSSSEP